MAVLLRVLSIYAAAITALGAPTILRQIVQALPTIPFFPARGRTGAINCGLGDSLLIASMSLFSQFLCDFTYGPERAGFLEHPFCVLWLGLTIGGLLVILLTVAVWLDRKSVV